MNRTTLLLAAALLLAGCTSALPPPVQDPTPPADVPPAPPPPAPPPVFDPAPDPAPARPQPNAATLALLDESRAASAAEITQRAIAQLERAIRIAPRDATLWTALAAEHVAAGEPAVAIQQAHKAIALAGERLDLVRDAWLVIADAEEAQGNTQEARRIRSEWRTARG